MEDVTLAENNHILFSQTSNRKGYGKLLGESFIGVLVIVIASLLTNILFDSLGKDIYVGLYYPDAGNLTEDIKSNSIFNSLEDCRGWIDKQILIHNPNGLNYDYECGKNCDLSGGKPYICEETVK